MCKMCLDDCLCSADMPEPQHLFVSTRRVRIGTRRVWHASVPEAAGQGRLTSVLLAVQLDIQKPRA